MYLWAFYWQIYMHPLLRYARQYVLAKAEIKLKVFNVPDITAVKSSKPVNGYLRKPNYR